MPAMVGTAGLDWVLSMVGATHSDLDGLLSASAVGAGGVAALPYLSPAGERAPFVDPGARAQFTGLSLATTGADLVRAYCEALAYAARHCFEAAGLTGSVTVCGGGAVSAGLLAIMANALGRPVAAVTAPEVTADGAAVAAGGSAESDRRQRHASRIVDPVPPDRMRWDGGYAAYLHRLAIEKERGWSARDDGAGHPHPAMVARPVPAQTGDRPTSHDSPLPAPALAEYPTHPASSARQSDTPIGGMG
jgi:sugar (pentulose or hexulose) kinase